eukprot:TRINITY_DN5526_c0_g1_i3.p1 TRINITY_DN5526_c0_g1~~TRINITY_DN5526_c0_g1_i3.p1  ORF type:complete len:339 (-),score=79.32 TRINITY_DN5526_c0_g1_i3:83-1099(-)
MSAAIDVCGDGGVMKEILFSNDQEWETPKTGAEVTVHYTGTLIDGTKFDSSRDFDREPFKFKLGAGQVIKGWDKVVATMMRGEKCRVTLTPDYGYGIRGAPPKIPPNSHLVFEIELLSFSNEKDLTNDGGVIKKILLEGEEWITPSYETKCSVNLRVENQEKTIVYYEGERDLTIGDDDMPQGLEKGLESMTKLETCSFLVTPQYAFNAGSNTILIGGEGTEIKFTVENPTKILFTVKLKSFIKSKESWELDDFDAKLEASLAKKNDGNKFFEKSKIDMAIRKYKKAIDIFTYEKGYTDEEQQKIKLNIKLPSFLNLAACYLKLKDYNQAIQNSNKVE